MMKPTVLIVEDEEPIALAEKMMLEDLYDVHIAADGEEGLNKVKKLKPHAVVLDIMMPKMDGFEVCKHIRNDPSVRHTKIVMVTSKNQQLDEDKGMDYGADDYIMKPFEPDELLHVMNQVLNRK
ncbi:response regulator [Candidatus Woesearchaeota archaeon]|nr:response regulator [Candidatus Woesearchaeota archaeon]